MTHDLNLLPESAERDSVTRFSTSGFFMNQFPNQPQSIPLGPFQIFSKIRGDIRSLRCATGVVDTGAVVNRKNLLSDNLTPFGSRVTYRSIFSSSSLRLSSLIVFPKAWGKNIQEKKKQKIS
jgi:hypothetical protein